MLTRTPFFVVFLVVLAVSVGGVTAQEVENDIEFEDEVVAGEETTITYTSTVVETPAEMEAEIELDLLVDGKEVDGFSTEGEISEGAVLRTDFDHTFVSSGERRVTVEATATVSGFGPELTDSTTANVTVLGADSGGVTERETGSAEQGGSADGGVGETYDEGEGGGGTGTGTPEGLPLPGFTPVAVVFGLILVALALVTEKKGR